MSDADGRIADGRYRPEGTPRERAYERAVIALDMLEVMDCKGPHDQEAEDWFRRRLREGEPAERAASLLQKLLEAIHSHEGTSIDDCPCSAVWALRDEIAETMTELRSATPSPEKPHPDA